jgi:alpha-glucosidase
VAASGSDWWKHAIFYEICPRSFKDSNGDGIGDLNGITSKLDYLADIGIDAIWITPFYPSPQVDFGYDVSDYENVDPQFGTLSDFDRLLAEAHKRNIKVICDFVINHTSDQHRFFLESKSSRTSPKRDWYIWRDPKPCGGPPNNWASMFGGSAWTRDDRTAQYYYHFFYAAQPDLNWRNPAVAKAMFDSVRFWLRRGVDGFRVDAIDTLFEDPLMRDNPKTGIARPDQVSEQIHTNMLPENHSVFKQLRSVVDEFGPGRVLVGETYPPKIEDLLAYYGKVNDEFHMPFNFFLLTQSKLDANAFRVTVSELEKTLQNRPINYVLSNHDNVRAFDKFGDGRHNDEIAKLLMLMLLTLRGSPFFYYGEEIGMKTTPPERIEDVQDPIGKVFWPNNKGRDGERTPMQWTSERNAGFSTAKKSWLPVPPNAATRNVATMEADRNSILNFFRNAVRLRRDSPAILFGDYKAIGQDPNVFAYRRTGGGQEIIVALNMSDKAQTLELDIKTPLKVLLSSIPFQKPMLGVTSIQLAPFAAVMIETSKR